MKKILFAALFLCMVFVCVAYPLIVLAEEAGAIGTDITDFLTPEEFASFAGQVTFVVLVVQFLKLPIDQMVGHIKTEYVVYGVAVIAQVLAQGMMHGFYSFTWAFIPQCIAYAFLVAVVAMKSYKEAIQKVEEKKAALTAQKVKAPPNVNG
jgi:hypothetical protein